MKYSSKWSKIWEANQDPKDFEKHASQKENQKKQTKTKQNKTQTNKQEQAFLQTEYFIDFRKKIWSVIFAETE